MILKIKNIIPDFSFFDFRLIMVNETLFKRFQSINK